MEEEKGIIWYRCSICGKGLIQRLPNGLFRFKYINMSADRNTFLPRVNMKIHGSIQIQCFTDECREKHPNHWETFNFFNPVFPKKKDAGQDSN